MVDERGIHRFAECDVDELAERLNDGLVSASGDPEVPWQDPDEVAELQRQVASQRSITESVRGQLVAEQQSSQDLMRELRQARATAAEMAQLILDSGMADDLSYSARRQLEEVANGGA